MQPLYKSGLVFQSFKTKVFPSLIMISETLGYCNMLKDTEIQPIVFYAKNISLNVFVLNSVTIYFENLK